VKSSESIVGYPQLFVGSYREESGTKQSANCSSLVQLNTSPSLELGTPVRKQCNELVGNGESGLALIILEVPELIIERVIEEVVETKSSDGIGGSVGVDVGVGVGVGTGGTEIGLRKSTEP
jgi:hypothetical protein